MITYIILVLHIFLLVNASPNFIMILTDDQDLILDGLIPMQKTLKLVAGRGKVFENAFVNTPICCPSRSTILTGKFAHNTGVVNNSIEGNCSSKLWQEFHEPFSIAALLKNAKNYTTFYAGKYMNKYGTKASGGTSHIPKGYDWWIGLKGNSRYYNYTLSVNGSRVFHRDLYLTDVLANYSIDFLNNKPSGTPYFMTVATPAAHAPFTAAKRHENTFPDTKAVRNPSFNYSSIHKHWLVQMPPEFLPSNVDVLDEIQKHRMQSLLAVDEMVAKIVGKVEELNELENTYVIFTSDNGFHIGQFSQPWDKRQPYETDIRVPMIIRGPKVPEKTVESFPISAVDIAPTILDLADVEIPVYMDGGSFKVPLMSREAKLFSKLIFVEYWGEASSRTVDSRCPWKYDVELSECTTDEWCKCQDSSNNTYTCVLALSSTQRFKYCAFRDNEGFREAYDLMSDPYELDNLYREMEINVTANYEALLNKFSECYGKSCRFRK